MSRSLRTAVPPTTPPSTPCTPTSGRIADGADALECDVRLTKDGHLVCVHDRRIDRTSNGRGILSTLELAELTELDWGSWRDTWEDFEDPEMPDRDKSQILTLRRLLEAVADVDRRVEVAIETKHPTRYAGLVERRLVALLDEFGWAPAAGRSPVRVMSFSQLSLRRLRHLAPDLRVGDAVRAGAAAVPGRQPARGGAPSPGPSIEIVRAHPRYVERAHRHGHPVHVWTVDAADDIDAVPSTSGSRRSSPTGPAGCSEPSAATLGTRPPATDPVGRAGLFRPGARAGHGPEDETDGDG